MALIRGGREEPVPLEPQIPGIAGRANDMPRTGFDRRADAVQVIRYVCVYVMFATSMVEQSEKRQTLPH